MPEIMLWNIDHTASVKASRIREITIVSGRRLAMGLSPGGDVHTVKGWFSSEDSFFFGDFEIRFKANRFVEMLHMQMAGGQALDSDLLNKVQTGQGETKKQTFTFYQRDIDRLDRLAGKINVPKSVFIRYLLARSDVRN